MSDALEALKSLLGEHRATLAQLYDSLGAPCGTVDAKISELNASLIETVKQQRRDAEHEVDGVRRQVDEARRSVLEMRKALGDETDEPVRSGEVLLAALKRLQAVHADLLTAHTARQKQFAHAYDKLRAVLPVLGPAFLSPAIVIPPADSSERLSDLTLATLNSLEREVARCDAEVSQRKATLVNHLGEVLALWSELGISPSAASSSKTPSTPESDFDALILAHLSPASPAELPATLENLARAARTRAALDEEKARREGVIQEVYDDLYNLWNKLGVEEDEQEAFIERWKGTEQRCVDAYCAERDRMLVVKAENMVLFIQREREDILRLWDELYIGEEERADCMLMHAESASEETLLAHELERKRLEDEREDRATILVPLNRYFGLLNEVRELEASASDPSRLLGKGVRGDPGRLLREEKTRKRIAKEKPKLEADLQRIIPEWEAARGTPFLVHGMRYLDSLAAQAGPKRGQLARSRTPGPGERAKTPGPGERAAPTPAPLRAQHTGGSGMIGTSTKRPGTASVAATPTVVKRPRANTGASGIKPFGTILGNGGSMAPSSSRPANRAVSSHIPTVSALVYPSAMAAPKAGTFRPRPSAAALSTSTSSASMGSGRESLWSQRSVSTATTVASWRDKLGVD